MESIPGPICTMEVPEEAVNLVTESGLSVPEVGR